MTLASLLTTIGNIGIHDRMINFSAAGPSIYQMNDLTIDQYPYLFISPTGAHRVEENWTTYQLSIFYVDRLLEDNSNDIDVQSTAVEVLKNIIKKTAQQDGVAGVSDEYVINLFIETEKFKDHCLGAYATVEFSIINDSKCVIYSNDGPNPNPPGPTPPGPEPPYSGETEYYPDNRSGYSREYLTIEILSAGTIAARHNYMNSHEPAYYSKDAGETWIPLPASFRVDVGDRVHFKALDNTFYPHTGPNEWLNITLSGSTAVFFAEGNAASVSHWAIELFNNTKIVSAANLVLNLTNSCERMFENCRYLVTPPAVIFDNTGSDKIIRCHEMFKGCTSLTTAPELPSRNMIASSYVSMFEGCTSLTTAPQLPATRLAELCYASMFEGCTSLTTAPELPATELLDGCYWSMFEGCTSLTTAPELPAAALAERCYLSMFEGCTSLNYVNCLATDISAYHCVKRWLYEVSTTGTFTKAASMSDWPIGNNGIPAGWTIEDAT